MSLIRTLSGVAAAAAAPPGGGHPDFPGNAYQLPGSNVNYLHIANPGLYPSTHNQAVLSVSCHVQQDVTASEMGFQWNAGIGVDNAGGRFYMPGAGSVSIGGASGPGDPINYFVGGARPAGQRFHFYGVWDAGNNFVEAFVDGVSQVSDIWPSASVNWQFASNGGWGIGVNASDPGTGDPTYYLTGWIVQFGVFTDIKTGADFTDLLNGRNPHALSNCIASYSLDPTDAGGGLTDRSAQGNNSVTLNGSLSTISISYD